MSVGPAGSRLRRRARNRAFGVSGWARAGYHGRRAREPYNAAMGDTRAGLVDILREFMAVYVLTRQVARSHRAGELDFEQVRALVGDDESTPLVPSEGALPRHLPLRRRGGHCTRHAPRGPVRPGGGLSLPQGHELSRVALPAGGLRAPGAGAAQRRHRGRRPVPRVREDAGVRCRAAGGVASGDGGAATPDPTAVPRPARRPA